jgi:hypothetical protein
LQRNHDRPYGHDYHACIFIQNARTCAAGSYKTQFATEYLSICHVLPYALDRKTQIAHIKKNLHNDDDCEKIWIIHGDRDQCHEPFLNCVKSIYWDQLGGRAHFEEPIIIHFDCPDLSNNFTDEFLDAIWLRIKKDDYLIPKKLTDLSVLFEQHHDGPIILNTRFYTQTWKKLDKQLLHKLFFTYEGICKKSTTHPLILCVFVIYEQPKSYLLRRKHHKRKKRIMADLKDFEAFEVPVLERKYPSKRYGWMVSVAGKKQQSTGLYGSKRNLFSGKSNESNFLQRQSAHA